MLVDHHAPGNSEPLTGAAADLLGREERIEDALLDRLRDTAAGVADAHDDVAVVGRGGDRDATAHAGGLGVIGDRVGGIDDDIEEGLVELADVAHHKWQLAEVGDRVGDELVLIGGDGERRRERGVDVGRGLLATLRVGVLLHSVHDRCDPSEAFERAGDGFGNVDKQVVEICFGRGVLVRIHRGTETTGPHLAMQCPLARDDRHQIFHGVAYEVHAVTHELDGGIDLVRDTSGKATDRLELLVLTEVHLHPPLFGHVEHEAHHRALRTLARDAHQRADRDIAAVATVEGEFYLAVLAGGTGVTHRCPSHRALGRGGVSGPEAVVEERGVLGGEDRVGLRPDVDKALADAIDLPRNSVRRFEQIAELLATRGELARSLGDLAFDNAHHDLECTSHLTEFVARGVRKRGVGEVTSRDLLGPHFDPLKATRERAADDPGGDTTKREHGEPEVAGDVAEAFTRGHESCLGIAEDQCATWAFGAGDRRHDADCRWRILDVQAHASRSGLWRIGVRAEDVDGTPARAVERQVGDVLIGGRARESLARGLDIIEGDGWLELVAEHLAE